MIICKNFPKIHNLMEKFIDCICYTFRMICFSLFIQVWANRKKLTHFKQKLHCRINYEMSSICNWIAEMFSISNLFCIAVLFNAEQFLFNNCSVALPFLKIINMWHYKGIDTKMLSVVFVFITKKAIFYIYYVHNAIYILNVFRYIQSLDGETIIRIWDI